MNDNMNSIEWLIKTLDIDTNDSATKEVIEQAKEIRKDEMIQFAAYFYRENEWISSRTEDSFDENVERFARMDYRNKFERKKNGSNQ